jgi:hypothetical protein
MFYRFPRALGSKGFDPMAPVKPTTLYIDWKPYFSQAPSIAANLPPPWLPSPRGGLLYSTKKSKEEGGHKGVVLPRAAAAIAVVSLVVAAASSPWGGTSPSSSTTLPHHLYCNLLANMIYGTIYYFPMIYCVYV